jgi:hypothetical protein
VTAAGGGTYKWVVGRAPGVVMSGVGWVRCRTSWGAPTELWCQDQGWSPK